MATRTPTRQSSTQKKLTKAEFKLFSQSLPKELKNLSEKRIGSALHKSEELVAKYRLASRKASPERRKLMEFRLQYMQKVRDRYFKKANGRSRPKPSTREHRSLTEQPKMRVPLQDSPRDFFMRQEKEKMYDRMTKTARNRNSPMRDVSNRIIGNTKSVNKKGQVARDRKKAEREQM
jgi:hypothetical protein